MYVCLFVCVVSKGFISEHEVCVCLLVFSLYMYCCAKYGLLAMYTAIVCVRT